jgi:hypothetical protein
MRRPKVRTLKNFTLFTVGYLLSPLSWWNDAFINLPLAYLFGSGLSLFSPRLFFPGMVLGYWLTNFAGFLLMHKGVEGMIQKKKWGIWKSLLVSLIYTGIIFLLYRLKIIRPPF